MSKSYMVDRWAKYRVDAFWKRVEVGNPDMCWKWTGLTSTSKKNPTPYGVLGWCGNSARAHRVAYLLACGVIPDGMMVLHKCDNSLCCNPDHLYLGDHAQNMRDMVERKRRKGVGVGSCNGRAKLTQAQANEIRSLYAVGVVSQQTLAIQYGISQFAVSQIILNKRYKDEI